MSPILKGLTHPIHPIIWSRHCFNILLHCFICFSSRSLGMSFSFVQLFDFIFLSVKI